MDTDESYNPDPYEPPKIIENIGNALKRPFESRNISLVELIDDSNDDNNDEDIKQYINGLIAIAKFFVGIALVWYLILLFLKCRKDVGCAAGRSFEIYNNNKNTMKNDVNNDNDDDDDDHDNSSTTNKKQQQQDDEEVELVKEQAPPIDGNSNIIVAEEDDDEEEDNTNNIANDDTATGVEVTTEDAAINKNDKEESSNNITLAEKNISNSNYNYNERNFIRQQRTRIVFVIVGFIVFICNLLLSSKVYQPFQSAVDLSFIGIRDVKTVILTLDEQIQNINTAIQTSEDTITTLPKSMSEFCPRFNLFNNNNNNEEETSEENIDLTDVDNIIEFTNNEFDTISNDIETQLAIPEDVIDEIDIIIVDAQETIILADTALWVIPFVISFAVVITIICMLRVGWLLFITKDPSTTDITSNTNNRDDDNINKNERCVMFVLQYILLPLLILTSIFCWILVNSTAMGTAVTYDACTAGTPPGSIDKTVHAILGKQVFDPNSIEYKVAVAYTSGCQEFNNIEEIVAEPIEKIQSIRKVLQDTIESIDSGVTKVTLYGIDALKLRCGKDNQIDNVLEGVKTLREQLRIIIDAIQISLDTVQCSKIHPIYKNFAHEALCTDIASANASGFVLYFIISICIMILLSLRAAMW